LRSGSLSAYDQYIAQFGTGTFTQTSGTNTVTNTLTLALSPGSKGTYNLQGGTLQVGGNEFVGVSGTGTFTQTGGTHTVNKTLILSGAPDTGVYNLQGGTLTAKDIQINSGGVFNVSNVTTTVTGNVLNNGSVKTTKANVTWNGSFINNKEYITDPPVPFHYSQTFSQDLVVGPNGYLVGHSQVWFVIKNDFKNQSTQNTLWDTDQATLKFVTGPDNRHLLYIPGADMGKKPAPGYTNNFAWGTLDIAGQIVNLLDGNSVAGGVLYVGGILGVSFSTGAAAPTMVTNIIGPSDYALNIYYLPELNNYLLDPVTHKGRTYFFASGKGALMPYHTPVPASVLLLGSGLLGLGAVGWRRRRSS